MAVITGITVAITGITMPMAGVTVEPTAMTLAGIIVAITATIITGANSTSAGVTMPLARAPMPIAMRSARVVMAFGSAMAMIRNRIAGSAMVMRMAGAGVRTMRCVYGRHSGALPPGGGGQRRRNSTRPTTANIAFSPSNITLPATNSRQRHGSVAQTSQQGRHLLGDPAALLKRQRQTARSHRDRCLGHAVQTAQSSFDFGRAAGTVNPLQTIANYVIHQSNTFNLSNTLRHLFANAVTCKTAYFPVN